MGAALRRRAERAGAAALALVAALATGPLAAAEGEFVPGPYIEMLAECYGGADTLDDRRACIGQAAQACQEEEPQGQTTLGIVTCTGIEADAWGVVLNGEYQQTMETARQADAAETMPEYSGMAEALREAQRAWAEFNDAECRLAFAAWGSGSMRYIAAAECRLRMIAERAIELRAMREDF